MSDLDAAGEALTAVVERVAKDRYESGGFTGGHVPPAEYGWASLSMMAKYQCREAVLPVVALSIKYYLEETANG